MFFHVGKYNFHIDGYRVPKITFLAKMSKQISKSFNGESAQYFSDFSVDEPLSPVLVTDLVEKSPKMNNISEGRVNILKIIANSETDSQVFSEEMTKKLHEMMAEESCAETTISSK